MPSGGGTAQQVPSGGLWRDNDLYDTPATPRWAGMDAPVQLRIAFVGVADSLAGRYMAEARRRAARWYDPGSRPVGGHLRWADVQAALLPPAPQPPPIIATVLPG